MLQFANQVDYSEAFQLAKKVCASQVIGPNSEWLQYVWETPILEALTSTSLDVLFPVY